jgi:uncharacterized protein
MSTAEIHARAAELIVSLALIPHPEGGHFREVYRSGSRVHPADVHPPDDRPDRTALTTIYFLLASGEVSRWHRVCSDEAWHFYEGEPLELLTSDSGFEHVTRRLLGPAGGATQPVHVVCAGDWQAARSTGRYTLVGCTVAPGFEFSDFQMLRDRPDDRAVLERRQPDLTEFI